MIPWYTPTAPWPYGGRVSRIQLAGSGKPQLALSASSSVLGYSVGLSGAVQVARPATLGWVLNLSAAAQASGPSFTARNSFP